MTNNRVVELRYAFLNKHKDADILEMDAATGCPLRAIYHSHDYKLRTFFTARHEAQPGPAGDDGGGKTK